MLLLEVEVNDKLLIVSLLIALIVVLFQGIIIYRLITQKQEHTYSSNVEEEENNQYVPNLISEKKLSIEDITDEDMMVAALVATIDYTNETNQDVRLVSIKQIG